MTRLTVRCVRLFALLVLCWAALVPLPMAVAFACNSDAHPALTIAGEIQGRAAQPDCDSSKASGNCNARQACATGCSDCNTGISNHATLVDFLAAEQVAQPRSYRVTPQTVQPHERPPRLI